MTRLAAIGLIMACVASACTTCLAGGNPSSKTKREPLPNGYAVFFANSSEAALVKPATKGGECIVGPHVIELGHSSNYIFGRIQPNKGAPPHPDHAPGFFVLDSATDKATTGLDREKWLTNLKALGVDSPVLYPPERIQPKKY